MSIIRPKDKIEKYLDSLSLKHGDCEVSTGVRSRYYSVAGNVLRISDHIGVHNEAYVSIIVPSFRENTGQYIVHGHNRGQISVVDYEKVKEIARSFFYLSSIFGETSISRPDVEEEGTRKEEIKKMNKLIKACEELEEVKGKFKGKGLTVLGVPANSFTKGQLNTIEAFIKQIGKKAEEET